MRRVTRTFEVGELEIVWLPDASGSFGTYESLFPTTSLTYWENWRSTYPELFDGDAWVVDFGAYAVHSGDTITLVDTGLGPPPGEENFMYRRQGWLPQSLRDAGIAPADVDIVFSTHHHSDHIGWNTIAGRPHLDRARYVSPAESWEWTMANRTEGFILEQMEPLRHFGVVDLVEDGDGVATGLRAIATPGHYPGHMSLLLESGDSRAVILGDVAVHPAQLTDPSVTYAFDVNPTDAVQTRHTVVGWLRGGIDAVLCSHYPGGGVGYMKDGVALQWRPDQPLGPGSR